MSKAQKAHVDYVDTHASILAALARIEEVKATPTLIDLIPVDDWKGDGPYSWNINVCSASVECCDQLDSSDEIRPMVA